jgi:hypothetical protein
VIDNEQKPELFFSSPLRRMTFTSFTTLVLINMTLKQFAVDIEYNGREDVVRR